MNPRSLILKWSIAFVLMAGVAISAHATHLRAGEITVERLDCNSLRFRITVTVFTNTINTNVLFGGEADWLDFGDGNRILVPEQQNILRPDLGEGIAMASYTIDYTYSSSRTYTISYSEPNRNADVRNMDASVNTPFYIETRIIIDPFFGCNNSPKLLVPPIDRACTGVAWSHNPGAFDPDGDSLAYRLVVPFRDRNTSVVNYRDPNDARYYANFPEGNEDRSGPPQFSINPIDGTVMWDAPGDLGTGEYNIAFVVEEYRKVAGVFRLMGFVRRDMQIVVEECDNERPDLIVPEDLCVVAGTTVNATILGIDPDNHNVKIEAFSEIFNFAPAQSPATVSPSPAIFQPSNPPAELNFEWNTECIHVKDQAYQVVFKITDDPDNGPKLVTFKTWFITVIGPAPEWGTAVPNLATRQVNLQWDEYVCRNASAMQIWRRVDSFEFQPDSCQTGMPETLGYTLIETLPLRDAANVPVTSYLDRFGGNGAASGAQYCYRLVALFPFPKGGESYVSEEICIDPILADAPVITNVTIDKTGTTDGQITVRWTPPFELSRAQYPEIEYEVYRAEGFTGDVNLRKVNPGNALAEEDTVLIDGELNTRDIVYNYRIVLYANTVSDPATYSPIDTSAVASSVRLEAASELQRVTLNWSAFVPWSNIVQTIPNEHVIYRGTQGPDESTMVEIASINPATGGFTYVDEGQHNGEPLVENQEYCYRVMTRGAYGNPDIEEPLENFSQIICATPNDGEAPPCTPTLFVQQTDCEQFRLEAPCDQSSFTNVLTWNRPEGECAEDIRGYRIYRAAQIDGTYEWLVDAGTNGIVRDTFFIDDGDRGIGLSSLAYCYRIAAVDNSGNQSELSEPACNDNCPYYELPNVFTPNGDDCNDTFGAWRISNYYQNGASESGEVEWTCGPIEPGKCARFVEGVALTIYNRWGKEVYRYTSGGERSIYIDWNGRASDGSELAAGVYYYKAEVSFLTVDPAKRVQNIKGWVHLKR